MHACMYSDYVMDSDDYVEKCFEKPKTFYRTISVFCDVDTVVEGSELWWANDEDLI